VNGGSIRVRLTAWYLVVLAVATLALAGGSWWLVRRSLNETADTGLRIRIEGARRFLEGMERSLSGPDMQDEFREYAELAPGELLDVEGSDGVVLVRPALAGWSDLRGQVTVPPPVAEGVPLVVTLAEASTAGAPFRIGATSVADGARNYVIVAATPMTPAYDALARYGQLLGWLVPVVLLAAAIGGYWISGRALAPVDRMARAARRITLRSLDERLEVPPTDDELARLAGTFNDMLARLQASVADMVRLTAEASHELRTPVSLVRATAEVALGRERSVDEYRQALADVLAHSERLSTLVDDLLTLARADAGVEPAEAGATDAAALASSVGREVQAAVAQRGLTFDLDLPTPGAPVEVVCGPSSLRRLVFILLDNAFKYTPAGGSVRLGISPETGAPGSRARVAIEVTDTGPGIDPTDRPRVFERFYRGAAARHHAIDGSGLGLAIAKTIVERAGGEIEVGGGPGGRGCRVVVRLPATGGR
jgi:two-component system, OmpR family, heavy metal sensor histidine kinase CusS